MPNGKSDPPSQRLVRRSTCEPNVTISWHAGTGGDAALRSHVAQACGVEPEEVSVGRLCPRCGSAEHGRPWASHGVHVSLSRSGPHLLTAVSTVGPVGVDVEGLTTAEVAWRDVSELVNRGRTHPDADPAQRWCRLEAALKCCGSGLEGRIGVAAVPAGVTMFDLDAPDGYRAAVALEVR